MSSLAIKDGEYLAVPDVLVQKAAPPLQPRSKPTQPDGDGEPEGESQSAAEPPKGTNPGTTLIETDPEVRKLLRSASGLPPLPAKALSGQTFQF